MNDELYDSLQFLQKEKSIDPEVMMEAIKGALKAAAEKNYKHPDLDVFVDMNPETRGLAVYLRKKVVETVTDPMTEISEGQARMKYGSKELGDTILEPINSRDFNRIAVKSAKDVILQQIREAERKSL